MANIVRTYDFVNGAVADAEQVDTELNNIVAFIQNGGSVVHRDGSQSFSGHVSLVNSSPTLALHAASKGYVDGKVAPTHFVSTGGSQTATGQTTTASTNTVGTTRTVTPPAFTHLLFVTFNIIIVTTGSGEVRFQVKDTVGTNMTQPKVIGQNYAAAYCEALQYTSVQVTGRVSHLTGVATDCYLTAWNAAGGNSFDIALDYRVDMFVNP